MSAENVKVNSMNLLNSSNYPNKQAYRQSITGLLCLLLLSLGFVASRALISIATIVIFLNAFWPSNITTVWQRFRSNMFGIWAVLYLAIYLISFFWSDNKESWLQVIQLKLPFLLLPLGICSVPLEKSEFRRIFYISTVIISAATVLVSIGIFLSDWQQFVSNYKLSIPLPTTSSNDHIRFGLWLSFLVLLGFYCWHFEPGFKTNKWLKLTVWGSILLFIIYIHILSAKTGLLVLYIILVGCGYYYFSQRVNRVVAWVLPLILGTVAVIGAYKLAPTFKTKIDYVILEIKHVQEGERLNYNLSDQGRLITYDIALGKMKTSGILGTGAGDILDVMSEGYDEKYPEVPQELRFVPINQYLLEIFAFGWILGLVPIVLMSFSLFFDRQRPGQFFIALGALILIVSMMVEAMLQVQMGIFVYLFLSMWLLSFKWQQIPSLNKR